MASLNTVIEKTNIRHETQLSKDTVVVIGRHLWLFQNDVLLEWFYLTRETENNN